MNTSLYDEVFGTPKEEDRKVANEISSESTSLYDEVFGEDVKEAAKVTEPVTVSEPVKIEQPKSIIEKGFDVTKSNLGIGQLDLTEDRTESIFSPKPKNPVSTSAMVEEVPKPKLPAKGTTQSLHNQFGAKDGIVDKISDGALTIMANTVDALGTLAKDPMGAAGGAARVATILNAPVIGAAMAAGAGALVSEAINQLAFYDLPEWEEYKEDTPYASLNPVPYMFSGFNLENMYDKFTEGFSLVLEGVHKATEPSIEMLTGAPTKSSEITEGVAFAPFSAGQVPFHELSKHEWFEDSPNLRGVLKIVGDFAGAMGMGLAMHGGKKAPMDALPEGYVDRLPTNVREVRDIGKEIEALIAKKIEVENLPDEIVKRAEATALDIQKKQLELRAQEVAKNVSVDAAIREDLLQNSKKAATKKPKVEKKLPDKLSTDAEIEAEFVAKKSGNKYVKSEGKWYDSEGKVVTNGFIIKSAEKGKKGVEKVEEVKVESPTEVKVEEKPTEKPLVEEPVVEGETQYTAKTYHVSPYGRMGETTPDKATEGFGEYSFLKESEAKGFAGDKLKVSEHEVTLRKPLKTSEPAYNLLEDARVEDPIRPTDSEYLKINKQAYQDAKANGVEDQATISAFMTLRMSEAGYDGLVYDHPNNTGWIVKFNPESAKDFLNEKGYIQDKKLIDPIIEEKPPQGESHPFAQDRKTTITQKKIFDGKRKIEDVEIFTQKLINQANQWVHDVADIKLDEVKKSIDELVHTADDYRHHFISGKDLATWKATVVEAAVWLRTLDRYKINQSGSSGTRKPGKGKDGGPVFGMMILPVDKIPKAVSDILKGSKKLVQSFAKAKVLGVPSGEIYRNVDIWKKTSHWLAKDGKWRYTLKSNKIKVDAVMLKGGDTHLLGNILDYPELFEAVPALESVRIKVDPKMKDHGVYSYNDNLITVKNPHDMYVILHEVSHALSNEKGTFRGSTIDTEYRKLIDQRFQTLIKLAKTDIGKKRLEQLRKWVGESEHTSIAAKLANEEVMYSSANFGLDRNNIKVVTAPTKAYEKYLTIPGEMEARLVEKMSKMSEKEVDSTPPWEILDNMLVQEQREAKVKYRAGSSNTLYSGIPIPNMADLKDMYKSGKDVMDYFTKAKHHKRLNFLGETRELKREGVRAFLGTSGNLRNDLLKIQDAGWELLQLHSLAKNANSKAIGVFENMFKVLDTGLSHREREVRDRLIFTNRVLDIAGYKTPKQFKLLQTIDPVKFAIYKEGFALLEGVGPKKAARIRESANDYFSFMKLSLGDMYKSGLLTKENYEGLASHNYSRMVLAENIDEFRYVTIGGKQVKVYDSGIQALSSGKPTDMLEHSSRVLAFETLSRAYGRIENNRLNKRMAKLAIDSPDNPYARVKIETKEVVNGKEVVKKTKIPKGFRSVDYFEEGEKKKVYLHPEIYKEWVSSAEHISNQFAKFLEVASGTRILKTFATGIEATFALVNLPWDVMRTMWSARTFKDGKWEAEYSPVLPIAAAQEVFSIGRNSWDVIRRKGIYNEWVNECAKPNFLALQGRVFRKGRFLGGPAEKINDTLGYVGETSEALTRVGIYDHHIRKVANERGISYEETRADEKVRREAAFISLDNTNFGEYGYIMGGLNHVSPYLTAGVVGNRSFYRTFIPGSGTSAVSFAKLAQFSAAVIGTYAASQIMSPKTMDQLHDDPNMERSLAIPLGDKFGFEDQYGQERFIYFKFPISHEMRVFKAASEAAYDKAMGNPVNVERVVNAAKNINPVGSPLPPLAEAYNGYVSNIDLWRHEEITNPVFPYPMSKDEGYPNQTSDMFKDIANKTGLSGPRSEFFVESLLTSNSMWLWMGGKAYEKLLMDLPEDQYKYHWAEIAQKTPGLNRYIGITNPYQKSRKNIDQEQLLAEHDRHVQNTGLDARVEGYLYRGTDTKSEVIDYIKQFKDQKVQERLYDRFVFQRALNKTQDMDLLNNRSFWLRMQNVTDPEARAKIYINELDNSLPDRAKELKRELGLIESLEKSRVPHFKVVSEPFIKAYIKLVRERSRKEEVNE